MANILAVDDDVRVLRSISRLLEDTGHTVSLASGGQEALDLLKHDLPDLVVLDIIMPEMDGLEVCRRIRADPFLARIPVLFLTAKNRPSDIAEALDAGGDDFLSKPFEVVELPARIRALLRRAPGGVLDAASEYVVIGNLRLHAANPELTIDDHLIHLSAVEHRLLHYLMLHAGQPVSTAELLEAVWEYPPGIGSPKLVHVHIRNLRAKIEPDPDDPQYILNVHGRGYLISR